MLRSVAAVQAKVDEAHTGNPGELLDSEGKVIFKLREFYAYFPADSGRLAPLKEVYETAVAGSEEEKKTRNVVKTTLPDKLGVRPIGDKLFLKSETPWHLRDRSIYTKTLIIRITVLISPICCRQYPSGYYPSGGRRSVWRGYGGQLLPD